MVGNSTQTDLVIHLSHTGCIYQLFYILSLTAAPIGEPVNVTALFVGPTSIHISWDHPPEDTHYGMIREYRINVTELETGAMFNASTHSETTELAVNSLHPFYTYTFVIVPVTVDVGTNHSSITIRTEETGVAILMLIYCMVESL